MIEPGHATLLLSHHKAYLDVPAVIPSVERVSLDDFATLDQIDFRDHEHKVLNMSDAKLLKLKMQNSVNRHARGLNTNPSCRAVW
jgi:prenyltransferase beta subunit